MIKRSEFAYPAQRKLLDAAVRRVNLIYGELEATIAAANGSEPCEVGIRILLNGKKFGEGEGLTLSSNSTSSEQINQPFGGQPNFNFQGPVSKKLTMTVSASGCAAGSAIQGTQVRVLGIG